MASRLKLLVRAWLPERGCCHLRSPDLTDAEARGLLHSARGVIEKAQESGVIEEVTGTEDRVFVMARRTPDPDHPNRTVPGFVLASIPDPDAFLHEVLTDRLRSVVEASGATGFEGWDFVDLGAQPREALSGWNREARPSRWRGFLYDRRVIFAGIGTILIAAFYFAFARLKPERENSSTPRPVQTGGPSKLKEREWNRRREQIDKVLKEPWAKRILDKTLPQKPGDQTIKGDGRQILLEFAHLFLRPALDLKGKDGENYEQLMSEAHPFKSFLSRLPESLPNLPVGDSDLSPAQAMGFLDDLKVKLSKLKLNRELGEEEYGQAIKLALNYSLFYDRWSNINQSSDCVGLLDKGREDKPYYRWVGKVREVIRVYCPP